MSCVIGQIERQDIFIDCNAYDVYIISPWDVVVYITGIILRCKMIYSSVEYLYLDML